MLDHHLKGLINGFSEEKGKVLLLNQVWNTALECAAMILDDTAKAARETPDKKEMDQDGIRNCHHDAAVYEQAALKVRMLKKDMDI